MFSLLFCVTSCGVRTYSHQPSPSSDQLQARNAGCTFTSPQVCSTRKALVMTALRSDHRQSLPCDCHLGHVLDFSGLSCRTPGQHVLKDIFHQAAFVCVTRSILCCAGCHSSPCTHPCQQGGSWWGCHCRHCHWRWSRNCCHPRYVPIMHCQHTAPVSDVVIGTPQTACCWRSA